MKSRLRGLRRPPPGGWPLDGVLVGVGTVKTLRELVLLREETTMGPVRAWDAALWSGVSVQGSTGCMKRLHRAGLVASLPPDRPWRARRYRLDTGHPLAGPLIHLFKAERAATR